MYIKYKWLLTGIVATLVGVTGTSLTASASTWHKGTPSILKGKYYRTTIKYGYQKIPQFYYLHGTKHAVYLTASQSDSTGGSSVYYKRSGKTYQLRMKGFMWQEYGLTHMKVKQLSSKKVSVNMNSSHWTMTRFYHFPKYHGKAVR